MSEVALKINTVEGIKELLQTMFGCAGCVINNNELLYPSEHEEGYEDNDARVLGFYLEEDYEGEVLEVSINDMLGTELTMDGLVKLPTGDYIQMLGKLNTKPVEWFIAFRSTNVEGSMIHTDEYEVCRTEELARKVYTEWVDDKDTVCAGIAPITDGTDWV